jgi:hypothetical protein
LRKYKKKRILLLLLLFFRFPNPIFIILNMPIIHLFLVFLFLTPLISGDWIAASGGVTEVPEYVIDELKKWGLRGKELEDHPALHVDPRHYTSDGKPFFEHTFTIPDLQIGDPVHTTGVDFDFIGKYEEVGFFFLFFKP